MKVGMSQKHTFEMEADPSQSLGGHIDISASFNVLKDPDRRLRGLVSL